MSDDIYEDEEYKWIKYVEKRENDRKVKYYKQLRNVKSFDENFKYKFFEKAKKTKFNDTTLYSCLSGDM